jgi:hypothetical protein
LVREEQFAEGSEEIEAKPTEGEARPPRAADVGDSHDGEAPFALEPPTEPIKPDAAEVRPPIAAEIPVEAECSAATLPDGHVDVGQASNFERLFKEALRPELRTQAKELAHSWLQKHRIVDSRGNPTAKAILKADFYQIRERAIAYAESL